MFNAEIQRINVYILIKDDNEKDMFNCWVLNSCYSSKAKPIDALITVNLSII